jgi:hypothetical protein
MKPTKAGQGTGPTDPQIEEQIVPRAIEEDDTEGHSMLPDPSLSRALSQAREREIQRHLKRHSLEEDARRPFKR